jgi:integrase
VPRKNKGNLYKKPGSPFWWFEFQVAGIRYRRSSGTATERDARAIARVAKEKAQAEAKERAQREAAGLAEPALWKIDELALKYGEATKDTLAGWRNVQRDLVRLVEFFDTLIADRDGNPLPSISDARYQPVTSLSDIRDGHLRLLVAARRRDRVRPKGSTKMDSELAFVQPGTVNHTVVRLQALFAYAKNVLGLRFQCEPCWADHKLAVEQKDARVFKGNEKERFDQATRADFEFVFAFAYESAKRLDYCANLQWPDVDWDRGVIVKPGKRKPGGKEKLEKVSITPQIRAILEPVIGHHPTFVFTYAGKRTRGGRTRGSRYPITSVYLETEFKRTCKRAGITEFGFHSLRRSGATEFYDATGNDLLLTQRFLGHASPQTTARYIRRDDDDIRAGMEKRAAGRAPAAVATPTQEVPTIGPHTDASKAA